MEFCIPMVAPSAPNLREHHMARAKRVKAQRGAVQRRMPKWTGGPIVLVRLTRISPRQLDGDNLQGAMKAIRDQVATGLLMDDRSPLVEWQYHQAKGEAEVVVQIWKVGEDAPPFPLGRPVERRLAPGDGQSGGTKRAAREFEARLRPPSTVKGDHKLDAHDDAPKDTRKHRKVEFNDAMDARVPERRAPRPAYTPPGAASMPASALRAAAQSIAQAEDPPTIREVPKGLNGRGRPSFDDLIERNGYEIHRAAERRALLAAQEAEAAFAPAPHKDGCAWYVGGPCSRGCTP